MPARYEAHKAPTHSDGPHVSGPQPGELRRALRRTLVWLALTVVLAGSGLWLGVTLRQRLAAMPGLSPRVPLAADKSYGVSADLSGLAPDELAAALVRMRAGGLRWVRQPFRWAAIEPAPGQFEWQAYDRVVAAVAEHGLRLIAVLDTTPAWARPPGSPPSTPPRELADFGHFARTLAARYGDRLGVYQIWDEPNLSAHWGDRFVEPAAYADLLREGAINIRAADPQAFILTAALAPTLEKGPLNLDEADFLEQLYLAHAAEWFDAVAAQPYGFAAVPGAPADRQQLNFGRVRYLRQVMERHRDEHKAVWVTSFGWYTPPASGAPGASPWPSVTPEQQENYTAQAIALARREWPWLGPMLAAAWDADRLPPSDARRGLALRAGEEWLSAGKAVISAAAHETNASVGWYPAQHPSGQYLGDWRFSAPARSALPAAPGTAPSRADIPRSPPAQLTITFEGTRLDLTVQGGTFHAFLYVTIDGQPANPLPQTAGRAFLGLYDPLEQVAEVTLARHLPDGRHTAVIEAEGGWYQWPILAWRVSREADVRGLQTLLVVVGALAGMALGGALISARRLPLVRWGAEWHAAYLRLGAPFHGLLVAGSALAFYLAPGMTLSLALLCALALAIWLRPDLGLCLVAFSIPFFLAPKALMGHTIAMTEVGLVLVASAYVVRRVWAAFRATPRRLDYAAWALTAIAAIFAFLTVVPLVQVEGVEIDWPAFALVLLPLAGLLAAGAERRGPADARTPWNWRLAWPVWSPVRQLDVAVAALAGLSLVSSLAADNVGVAFQEFHVVIWDAVAFYAFVRLERGRSGHPVGAEQGPAIPMVVEALWWGATGMAVYALYLFFFTGYSITAEGVHRALGVYGSPNNLALLLERVAPILLAVTAFGWSAGSPRHAMRRWSYGLALLINMAALLLTFSRGALWLGLPAAVLFIGVMRGRRVLAAALVALGVVVASALPLLGSDRLRLLFSGESGTSFFRLRVWQSAWTMLREHPWLGVGPDNFLYQYRTRYMLPDAWQEPNLSHPHNILLDLATRLGVGSLALFLWLQVSFWRLALPLYRTLGEGHRRALMLGLMASMLAGLAHGLVDHALFLVDLAYIFCLTLAVVANTALDIEQAYRG